MTRPRTTTLHHFTGFGTARRLLLALVLTVAIVCLPAPTPAAADGQTMFTLVGHGWGHGVGLCQWGAYGYAQHGWGWKRILAHYYTGVTFGRCTNRQIRVMLQDGLPSVSITASTGFKVRCNGATAAIGGGATARVTYGTGGYHVTTGNQSWTFGGPVTFSPGSSQLRLLNANDNGWSGHYRGTLRVVHFTTGLMVVNKLALEKYLYGVVPHESPASWPMTPLKTQAVAARSFAWTSAGRSGAYDVYCTTSSQMYYGSDVDAAKTTQAVNETRGMVPKYNGQPIRAYFFSSSGGHTESVENVWGGSPIPYLKGVDDPYDASSNRNWPENPIRKTPAALASALGTYSSAVPWGVKGTLRAIYVVRQGDSPRVVTALVVGSTGTSVISGARLRSELGLKDTWVAFTSISVAPAASTHRTITYGASTNLTGRRYPALESGAQVTLHSHPDGGGWTTRKVATARDSQTLMGYAVKSSTYSASVSPTRSTEYYVTSGDGISPHTTILVKPAVTLEASSITPLPGQTVVFTGKVTPVLAGATVWLQLKNGSGKWVDAVSTKLKADGAFSVAWVAAPGTSSLRLRVPKSDHLVQGTSAAVVITATAIPPGSPGASPAPAPTVPPAAPAAALTLFLQEGARYD
jgi:stage II sporulation protein D